MAKGTFDKGNFGRIMQGPTVCWECELRDVCEDVGKAYPAPLNAPAVVFCTEIVRRIPVARSVAA